MKEYLCTKKVFAEPMDRLTAESKGLVRDKTGINEDGYYVYYSSEYQSWSPEEVFENGYQETE